MIDNIQTKNTEAQVSLQDEALAKAIAEIDLKTVRHNYLIDNFGILKNIMNYVVNRQILKEKESRLKQLHFLEQTKDLTLHLPPRERAYVLLGAFQYAQGRWLPFPISGALFTLELKREDLVHAIGENDNRIKLEKLFADPQLINKAADEAFAHFLQQYPEIHENNRGV